MAVLILDISNETSYTTDMEVIADKLAEAGEILGAVKEGNLFFIDGTQGSMELVATNGEDDFAPIIGGLLINMAQAS